MLTEFSVQIDDFMLYCDSKNLSKKTLSSYEQTLRLFAHYVDRVHGVDDASKVSTDMIRSYIKYLRERGKYTVVSDDFTRRLNHPQNRPDIGKPLSDSTLGNYLRNIKVFFNYLVDERIVKKSPAAKIANIKPKRKKKKMLNESELKNVMRSFDVTTFYGYRSYMMTRLLLDTGLRISECLALCPEHINFKNFAIHVTNPKNGRERYVYFSAKIRKELQRWVYYRDRFCDSDWLFPTTRGTQMKPSSYEKTLRDVGKTIGVEVSPHQLRNNFAKYYLLNGGDLITLSRILGHSSVEVTKVYLDFDDSEIQKKYQRHSPLGNMNV
ncbi:tyrosine-type recombinase/integrase [Geomicrobium sp. JSM 1781026]|uniref:tyrosine-type recombinase/integrase n=1 Tax=Geomicrobium sp. JSM 1781026 TaxID=3344580 RepID=UPI0035BFC851